jgi:predicted alpha/beta-hydrolase family hydrolase
MSPKSKQLTFEVGKSAGSVGALLLLPRNARWLLVLAHGAGAGMRHPFMQAIAERLASHSIATFRYQFPYMEQGSTRVDTKPVLMATVHTAVSTAVKHSGGLPLLAGGKSMGGRMTSMAQSEGPLTDVKGLVFFGFPLHPAGQPSADRAEHLRAVTVPMLFLQGTRDSLADLTLLKPICKNLGIRATLRIIDGADHSFHVLKSSGQTDGEVIDELARGLVDWAATL